MATDLIIAQVLLILVVGLWLGAKFRDSPFIKFFGRNDWFTGAFLVLVGYMNYIVYSIQAIKNMNLILVVVGLIMITMSVLDHARN